jgi:hypothetical protein
VNIRRRRPPFLEEECLSPSPDMVSPYLVQLIPRSQPQARSSPMLRKCRLLTEAKIRFLDLFDPLGDILCIRELGYKVKKMAKKMQDPASSQNEYCDMFMST